MEEINQNSQTFLDFSSDILKPNNENDLQEIIKYCYKKDLPIEIVGAGTKNQIGNYYIYRATKAALNSISKNLSIDLNNNIIVASLHPGSIKTKMNPSGIIEPEICAKQIINFIVDCNESLNGTFIDLQTLKKIEW